jgi:serine/threonine protein kinase
MDTSDTNPDMQHQWGLLLQRNVLFGEQQAELVSAQKLGNFTQNAGDTKISREYGDHGEEEGMQFPLELGHADENQGYVNEDEDVDVSRHQDTIVTPALTPYSNSRDEYVGHGAQYVQYQPPPSLSPETQGPSSNLDSFSQLRTDPKVAKNPARNFLLSALLGTGAFGAVYQALAVDSKSQVAIKTQLVNHEGLAPEKVAVQKKELLKEINVLEHLKRCRYIAPVYNAFFVSKDEVNHYYTKSNERDPQLWRKPTDEVWIVMELCKAGTLTDLIKHYVHEGSGFSEKEMAAIIKQLVIGVASAHKLHVMHRDLKPDNVLLSDSGVCKLADFGISRELTRTMESASTQCGTYLYIAPEVICNSKYDNRADVYSLANILHELCMGYPPYKKLSIRQIIRKLQAKNSPVKMPESNKHNKQFSPALRAMGNSMFLMDPASRPTAEQLLDMPFIADVDEKDAADTVKTLIDTMQYDKAEALKEQAQAEREQAQAEREREREQEQALKELEQAERQKQRLVTVKRVVSHDAPTL